MMTYVEFRDSVFSYMQDAFGQMDVVNANESMDIDQKNAKWSQLAQLFGLDIPAEGFAS